MNVENPREFLDRRQLLSALRSFRRGDFTVRLPEDLTGHDSEIARLFNEIVSLNEGMTEENEKSSQPSPRIEGPSHEAKPASDAATDATPAETRDRTN